PVILEVPHFGSLRDKEREIIILRSDNGESWREHTLYDKEESVLEVLQENMEAELSPLEDLRTNRIIRIVTRNFPHFFAVVSRIRQEVHAIGSDGGTVSSQAVPQAQPVDLNGCCKLLGQGVAVSPVVTVEPRRRKFHKAITLSIPAPKACTQGMVNSPYTGSAPTLRLLCSITGGQSRAIWEDVTGSTPLAFVKDSVTFTTTVSARFWLMDCRNISEASRMASELYSYMALVPFMAKFVVFAKRISSNEAKLSIFFMTDDKEDKTLEHQDNFTEVAKSRDVEVLEDQNIFLEFGGNLVPVLKTGEQLSLKFQAFRENRLSFMVHVKNPDEPFARISFMNEPKTGQGEVPKLPFCTLNIALQGSDLNLTSSKANVAAGSQRSINSISFVDRGLNQRDQINAEYKRKYNEREILQQNGETQVPASETIHKADMHLSDICQLLKTDWISLAKELGVPETDIELINAEYADDKNQNQRAMVMLRLWLRQQGNEATGNKLQQAIIKIGRNDIVNICIDNVEPVTDDMERTKAEKQLFHDGLEGISNFINDVALSTHQPVSQAAPIEVVEAPIVKEKVIKKTQSTTIPDIHEERVKEDDSVVKTSPRTNIVSDLITTRDDVNEAVQQIKNYDIDKIRRIAEQHTLQVLEEAQQNIENKDMIQKQQAKVPVSDQRKCSNIKESNAVIKTSDDGETITTITTEKFESNNITTERVDKGELQTKSSQPEDQLLATAVGVLSSHSNVKNNTISITQSLIQDECGNADDVSKSELDNLKLNNGNIEAIGSEKKST
ncbi:hypothetical protein DOY81_008130, partial [Sarcophaga bullata]